MTFPAPQARKGAAVFLLAVVALSFARVVTADAGVDDRSLAGLHGLKVHCNEHKVFAFYPGVLGLRLTTP